MTSIVNISCTTNQQKKGLLDVEETAIPDSTTTVCGLEFSPGQDILKLKDGKYYLGTVVEIDNLREQCLLRFDDNTDNWSCFKDLVKFNRPGPEDILCVICKKSAPKNKCEITVCDKCGRGYHQKCHHPEIPPNCQKEDSNWMCKRCIEAEPVKQRLSAELKYVKKEAQRKSNLNLDNSIVALKQLPYEPDELCWDTYHRVNLEQVYCYCGQNGDWYTQMLQCGRCRQWFHEKCISCLQYPLYCGDRYYVFVCMNCNHGKEFVRRLELKWVDLIHLLLFNLTAYNSKSKKYYDLDSVIMPYVNDNWHALQLPPKIFGVGKSERRENILSVLTNNRNRFKCGREIKKRTTIWGLRIRLPPPAPCISLTQSGPITEQELKQRWQGNRRLQFLPYPEIAHKVVPLDVDMLNIMMGVAYQDAGTTLSDSDSNCATPELIITKKSTTVCVKKYKTNNKARLIALSLRKREKLLRRKKHRKNDSKVVKRRITRLMLDKSTKDESNLPLTPPKSVSTPPTPPTSNTSSNLSLDYTEHSNRLSNALNNKKFDDINTPCDTSGDETSSKSTLDQIIPPPKDFEGKNNPFLTFTDGKKRRGKELLTRKSGKPTKRQLIDAKDIVGDSKRRKLRRNYTQTGGTASKNAIITPIQTNEWNQRNLRSQISNCMDYALNGRRLRARHEKCVEKTKKTAITPTKNSPIKQDPDISLDDLKNSVNSYFGAATRILDGERFIVKAKRYNTTGKLEYLMEWDGLKNGMT